MGIEINASFNLIMQLAGSICELLLLIIIVAGFSLLAEAADGVNEFKRCYNTSVETHCFDLQYDNTTKNWLIASYENARQRCSDRQSTLLVIKDQDTNAIFLNYMSDSSNPVRMQYVWTDAYRINDYNNTYTWHWLNSTLPNIPASTVADTRDPGWYIAAIEFTSQFHLTAQQPYLSNSYVCEYSVSSCPSNGSNVRQFAGRCYVAVSASVSYYDARNLCLKDGGDLASFENVSSINFASWLASDQNVRYWIGLRYAWYIWKDSGEDVKFSKLMSGDSSSFCLAVCWNCNPSYSWIPKDCSTSESIYAVCDTVTPLEATTITTAITTTLPVTTTAGITPQTGSSQSSNPAGPSSTDSVKSISSPPIALAVGVGVGVGVPVIAAIIILIVCLVKRHQKKNPETSATTGRQREETSVSEIQSDRSKDTEIGHYATVQSLYAPKPSTSEEESTTDTQYAPLRFEEPDDLKKNKRQSPLSVL